MVYDRDLAGGFLDSWCWVIRLYVVGKLGVGVSAQLLDCSFGVAVVIRAVCGAPLPPTPRAHGAYPGSSIDVLAVVLERQVVVGFHGGGFGFGGHGRSPECGELRIRHVRWGCFSGCSQISH